MTPWRWTTFTRAGETSPTSISTEALQDDARTPVAGAGMVDGVIKDFMEGGESLGNWRVTLSDPAPRWPPSARLRILVKMENADAYPGPGMTVGGESTTQFVPAATARVGAASALTASGWARSTATTARTASRNPLPARSRSALRTPPFPVPSVPTTPAENNP